MRAVVVTIGLLLGAAPFAEGRVEGSGVGVTETRSVSGFSSIRLQSVGRLVVEQTGRDQLVVQAEDNIVPLLRTEVHDGTLVIDVRPGDGFRATRPVEFRVEVKSLQALEVSGSGRADLAGIRGDRLDVVLRGAGQVVSRGRVGELRLDLAGAGTFRGAKLVADRAHVDVRGAGYVVVRVVDALAVAVTGAGTVEYVGKPSVTQSVTGAGSVRRRDGPA